MIFFDNISKCYNKQLFQEKSTALSDISFKLNKGNTLGLIGANGAGKSTSIRLLMDFIRPDQGEITVFGHPPSEYHFRNKVGYLPETTAFPQNLNILNLISFTATTCGLSKSETRDRGEVLLKKLDLWHARKKSLVTFSKGMQQRASFVLALINDPELLILDEPMSGLDPLGRNLIITLIEELKQRGKTLLFCSHILNDVDLLVDDLLVLHKGKSLYHGSPKNFLSINNDTCLETAFVNLVHNHDN